MKARGGFSNVGRADEVFALSSAEIASTVGIGLITCAPHAVGSLRPLIRQWLALGDVGWLPRLERQGNIGLLRKLGTAWPKDVAVPDEIARACA